MLEQLKKDVYEANMLLQKFGLITFTWGNVSGIDRESGFFVIKPSGIEYDQLQPEDMVVVDLFGKKIEGHYNPSSDTDTHMALYTAFPKIGGVVHTHSTWATAAAQAGVDIPAYGTTHGDYFYGEIPCTRDMTEDEINGSYELETGNVIVETFKTRKIDENYTPAVLVKNHGPFTWGNDCFKAVENAVVLEEVSKMAALSKIHAHQIQPMQTTLLDKHFFRKHGKNAYYGQ